jgi:serine/threonine protein kinase/tetratricopeptide (TPR) repeat protein
MPDRDAQDAPAGATPRSQREDETVVQPVDARVTPTPLPALAGGEVFMSRPLDIDANEATYVAPMYLSGTSPPKIDTDREFPAEAGPPPAPPLSPPPGAPLAPPPVVPIAEPLARPPVGPIAEPLTPVPESPVAGPFSAASASEITDPDPAPGPASRPFSGPMSAQAMPGRPVYPGLPMTGAHPAFGFPAGGDGTAPEPTLLPGSIVGRYAIHSHIGKRGTGALYRAHDPRLGRDVALQMWRASSYLPAAASPSGMRFLKQARALAQVSHPHVLALLDVGAVGPNVFVTMEPFQDVTLDRWLATPPRKLGPILEVLAKAGHGLAAAHAAGVKHGDLQPAHIMVGKGNDVRVLDFGLNRALAMTPAEVQVSMRARTDPGMDPRFARPGSSSTDLELGDFGRDEAATEIDISVRDALPTEIDMDQERLFNEEAGRGSTAAGRPPPPSPYTAPEQYAGGATTARSDQFSFCAVLYEAVCGVQPFAGETPEARLENIRAARLQPAVPGHLSRGEIPAWLQALLGRGLAAQPEARYESMDELLAELDTRRTRRGRQLRWAVIIAAVLGSFALGAVYATTMGGGGACENAQERIDAVWNDEVVKAMTGTFVASGAPEAMAAHARVVALLDGYERAWLDMHAVACAETDADGSRPEERSEEDIEAARADRLQCLSARLASLQALTRGLTAPLDRAAVENAVGAAAALPSIESCASAASRRAPLPENEQAQADIAALQAEIADASALVALGQHERMAADADALLGRATKLGHPPTEARAHLLVARVKTAAGQHGPAEVSLRQALERAEQGPDDDLAAEIWVDLVNSIGLAQERHDEALAVRAAAEQAVERARVPDIHRTALFGHMAVVLAHLGRHDEARALAERALALVAKTRGPDSVAEIEPLEALAQVLQRQGRHREALAPLERALGLIERYYGRAHVRQAPALMATGASHLALGQPESALTSFAQARDIEEAYHGLRSARAADVATEMGRALCWQGKYEQAVAPLEKAIELGTKLHGAESPRITPAMLVMAELRAARGEHEQAQKVLERALAIRERRLGTEHPDTAQARARLGHVLVELGDRERARPLLESALAALEKARGENHPDLAPALSGLGALWREENNERRVRRVLDRQLAILRQHLGDAHPAVAAADDELGEALLVVDSPSGARPSFARAREILEAEGRKPTPLLARVLTGLAVCELDAGEAQKAIPLLERALTIHTERPGDPVHLARTRFALARALWASRADRTRALTLGQQAEQALSGLGPRAARELKDIQKWLESDGS